MLAEQTLGIQLPLDLRASLLYCNGADLIFGAYQSKRATFPCLSALIKQFCDLKKETGIKEEDIGLSLMTFVGRRITTVRLYPKDGTLWKEEQGDKRKRI